MCGILGVVASALPKNDTMQSLLRRMGWWQYHRGPDGWGEWIGDGVGLGHNRLAILDPVHGCQPMASEDGRIQVVFNGEIYNFRALWAELAARGYRFRTDHSDTEVVVHGYREWGSGVFARLEGMFALAIWDENKKRLVLARDRLGIKPLYFCCTTAGLVFASEPKAILGSGWIRPDLDPQSLPSFFMFRAPLAPATLVRGVQKLSAGSWCEYDVNRGMAPAEHYWSLLGDPTNAGEASLGGEALERAVEDAVVSHLVADVPVGLFLSGGVDSSLVAAVAAKHTSIDAFTVGTHSPLDESQFASQVASHLGVPLHVCWVTGNDFRDRFEEWCFFNDDPVADPSALALMVVAEHARKSGMKVMLAGEGADELFGGYSSYLRYSAYAFTRRVPLVNYFGSILGLAASDRDRDYLRSLKDLRFRGSAHVLCDADLARLFAADTAEFISEWAVTAFAEQARSSGPARSAMLFDQGVRLPNDLLPRTDRATMAYSLEARVPYLDRRVVELANTLSDQACVRLFPPEGKILLKRLAARKVPPSAVYRKKRGFNLPIEDWLGTDFAERVAVLLDERSIAELNYDFLRSVYRDHLSGHHRADLLWAWLVLEEWHRLWIKGQATRLHPAVISDQIAYDLLSQTPALA